MSKSRFLAIVVLVVLPVLPFTLVSRAADMNGDGIDDRLGLPGTQPVVDPAKSFTLDQNITAADDCQACHAGAGLERPFTAWNGSMMANAGRDPLFWAQLDLAEFDEGAVSDGRLKGARDLCLRCHAPKGWLEGFSHDPMTDLNATPPKLADEAFLRGMKLREDDLFGVQCEVCHRMVDPNPGVALASVDPVDRLMLDGGPPGTGGLLSTASPSPSIPQSYGAGMYVLDRKDVRRGPYSSTEIGYTPGMGWQFIDTVAKWTTPPSVQHRVKHSSFHREGNLCGTCHDVSNPAWAPRHGQALATDVANAQAHFPIERTLTEWQNSVFPSRGEAGTCQGCHMSGPLNQVIAGPVSDQAAVQQAMNADVHLNDVHVHDFTGGNAVIPLAINAMIQKVLTTNTATPSGNYPTTACSTGTAQEQRDCFLDAYYATVIRGLYPNGAFARATGLADPTPKGYSPSALQGVSTRARATLARAAELSKDSTSTNSNLKLMVWNKTGHKLPTGYPEGRRMWLEVKFEDINATTGAARALAWSGEYANAAENSGHLFHDFDMNGSKTTSISHDRVRYTDGTGTGDPPMDGGTPLTAGRRTQVWEYRGHHEAAAADTAIDKREFHFMLNNKRERDNRIPPEGWNKTGYSTGLADQLRKYTTGPNAQMEYQDTGCGQPTCNFDRVPYPVPSDSIGSSDSAWVTLYYQTASREYIKALQADNPRNLLYQHTGDTTGFSRGDVLEHAWRTFNLSGFGKRFPPVEMAKQRVAIRDADGDGLPDDWETFYSLNPNGTSAAQRNSDRHGDPDNDGVSNYQEFQRGTSPAVAAGPTRPPLDLALVLDFSGSMSGQAPHGSQAKIEVLKEAVDLFLTTWKHYATNQDRLAIVYFSSTVAVEGGAIVDFSSLTTQTLGDKIDDLITAMRARPHGGATALGGGLQRALNLLRTGGTGHRKHAILFTNGMQNFSPMVRKVGSGYVIRNDAPAAHADVYGTSGETDTGGPAFGTQLSSLGATIHTIGIGVAETADDRWVELIQGIAQTTQDLDSNQGLYQFVSRSSELEGAFLTDLVESLRNFSPQLLARQEATLARGQSEVTLGIPIEAGAERATFIVSWAGASPPGHLGFSLTTPDGTPADDLGLITEGPTYTMLTTYFPLARLDGRPLDHMGEWTLTVSRRPSGESEEEADDQRQGKAWSDAVDFRAYVVAEIPNSDHNINFSKPRYTAGDEVILYAAVRESSAFVNHLTNVTAEISLPSTGFGTFLSKTPVGRDRLAKNLAIDGDDLPDRAAAKAYVLLTQEESAGQVAPRRITVTLHDDGNSAHGDNVAGDGVFAARLGVVNTPGLVTARILAEGQSVAAGPISRRYAASAFVDHAAFDETSVLVGAEMLDRMDGGKQRVRVVVTPTDTLGNYLGPGYADRIQIDLKGVGEGGAIEDFLDGRYGREFVLDRSQLGAPLSVTVEETQVFDGRLEPLLKPPLRLPFWLLILLLLIIAALILLLVLRSRP